MQDVLAKLKAIQENYDNEDIQRAITAAKKTAVSEDLIDAGSPLEDILEMNLFMDMLNVNPEDCPSDDEKMIAVNSDREFKGLNYLVTRGLCAKYKPIAEKLASQIEANSDRELTEDEVDMLNEVWYEASDLYQNGDVSELARIYDEQIQLVKQLLGGAKESVEKVNEFYVKSAKDVLNTLPAFAYRASDPVDDQPEDKMYTTAVGDRAEMLYNKLRKWLAAGNDFSPEEIEALDQAASAPEFMGPTSETDDQDVIDMLNSGLDTLENIIGNKTESVEESVYNSDLERMIKLAGRSGVLGMNTNVIIAESVEVAEEQVKEDSYDHTSSDGHEIKDVTDYDDYDGYSVELETPLGTVTAEWNSAGGRGGFGGIRASNRTLESMIGKIYGEMHDFESMDKDDWPVAVGKAVDKVMAMGKDNPSFMRSESVEEDSVEEVHEEEAVEETVEVPVSALQELMKLAGYEQYKIDEYANEPEEEYSSAEDQMDLGGGLNGPKKAYAAAAGGDNPMDQEPTEIEEDNKLTFEGMYKRYMTQVVEETLADKE